MIDRREQILSRLVEVLTNMAGATISTAWTVYRNKEDLSPGALPAFIVFDAHEERDGDGADVVAPSFGYTRIRMSPRIGLYASDLPENVGPILNGMRIAALKAIFADATTINYATPTPGSLAAAMTGDGAFFYESATTALDRGAEMTGEMHLNLTFRYPLLPTDF